MSMKLPSLLEINMGYVKQLKPEVQWAAEAWLADLEQLNLKMLIKESYRSQARQDELYSRGRTKPGSIVTWTRSSNHTRRLAVDVSPLNCSYEDLEDVAKRYGIHRDPVLVQRGDLGHFDLIDVGPFSPLKPKDPQQRLRELKRRLENTKNMTIIPLLKAEIERLEKRLSTESGQ